MGLRQSLPVFVQSLSSFASSRLQNLRASNTSLTDVPNGPFPDKAVLFDSNALTKQGRTSAEQFHRTGATKRWDDGHGSVFLCMRRTLATFDRAATKWIRAEDIEVTPPPAPFPETFALDASFGGFGLGAGTFRRCGEIGQNAPVICSCSGQWSGLQLVNFGVANLQIRIPRPMCRRFVHSARHSACMAPVSTLMLLSWIWN